MSASEPSPPERMTLFSCRVGRPARNRDLPRSVKARCRDAARRVDAFRIMVFRRRVREPALTISESDASR